MNTVKTLILKDFFEYKNDYRKLIFTLFMYVGLPVIVFNYSGISSMLLGDTNLLVEIFIVIATTFVYCETTLAQIRRSIRDGIFEKYYISTQIKKYEILVSKYVLNLLISFLMLLIIFISNNLLGLILKNGINFMITPRIIVTIIFSCWIGTCLAFINSLLVTDERNMFSYVISVVIIYLGLHKLFEIFDVNNIFVEIAIQAILSTILIKIVLYLLNKNRFIKRC